MIEFAADEDACAALPEEQKVVCGLINATWPSRRRWVCPSDKPSILRKLASALRRHCSRERI